MMARLRAVIALMRNPKVAKLPKFLVIAAVLYLLDPLDFLPDAAPVIGWLDDIAFLLGAFSLLLSSKPRADQPSAAAKDQIIDITPEPPSPKAR